MNNEYYAVIRSTDHLAHYGVLGMHWGVRKNPQKEFYKSMKRDMKNSLRENKAAHKTVSSGAKSIGKKLPRNMIRDYVKASDQLERAFSAKEKLEERARGNYQKTHKVMTKKEQQRFLNQANKLTADQDRAYENYDRVLNNAREQLLGKYGKKSIRMDSHNTRIKRDADYVLEAALRSQMPERNPVKLNSKQKQLEKKWKEATQRWRDASSSKEKQVLNAENTKAAEAFFNSMSEKQMKKYHDRYLL